MKVKIQPTVCLSIGLIVKNEQKHIENCMKALSALREQIPCEIIVADTGSTDKTVEIAKQYADMVFHFEWCDDFAAARNAVMDRASGEWLLTVDADEYMDADVSELVAFLRSLESKSYNMMALPILNHTSKAKTDNFSTFYGVRFIRMSTGIRYKGRIHESLDLALPIKTISTKLHHYGYAFRSNVEWKNKAKRNMELLEEDLKTDPKNLYRLVQALESSYDLEYGLQFATRALEVSREDPDHPLAKNSYLKAVDLYFKLGKYDEALKIGNEFYERYVNASIVHIDIAFLLTQTLLAQEKWDEMLESGHKFLQYCKMHREGGMDQVEVDLLFCSTHFDSLRYENCVYIYIAGTLIQLKQYEESDKYLQLVDHTRLTVDMFFNFSKLLFQLVEHTKKYELVKHYYSTIRTLSLSQDQDDQDKAKNFFELFEYYYLTHKADRIPLAQAFTDLEEQCRDDDFMWVMQMSLNQENANFSEELDAFLQEEHDWKSLNVLVYYLVIKQDKEFPQAALDIPVEHLTNILSALSKSMNDFGDLALPYCRSHDAVPTIRHIQFKVLLLSSCISAFDEMSDQDKAGYAKLFIDSVVTYLTNVYNEDILNQDDIVILSSLHRFGFYVYKAALCRQQGDTLNYVRNLRIALDQDHGMRTLINYLTMEIENEQNEATAATQEFQQLADTVMLRVRQFIDARQIQAAREILEGYLKIQPNDVQALKLKDDLNL